LVLGRRKGGRLMARDFLLRLQQWSRYFLASIVILSASSIALLATDELPQWLDLASVVLLGVVLVLACLFAFPYASVWKDKTPFNKDDFDVANGIRTMLISVVGGAFAMTTLYLSYSSTRIAAESAKTSHKQQVSDALSSAGTLIGHENPAVRMAGLRGLERMLNDHDIAQRDGYRILTLHVRSESHWTPELQKAWTAKLQKAWAAKSPDEQLRLRDSPSVGWGSLQKRATDVQLALDILSRDSKLKLDDGRAFRADLRDTNLQGAALEKAQLQRSIFNGSHLDYADGAAQADFQGSDFRGASLFGASFESANLSGALFSAPTGSSGQPLDQPSDLRNVNFRRAILVGAKFDGADLRGAHLEGADLRKSTGLETAKLDGVTYDPSTHWPEGFWAPEDQRVFQLGR
jgi:hypothetical protein